MTRIIPLALSAALALAVVAGAVAPPVPRARPGSAAGKVARPPARGPRTADQLDFIFFASDRPVLVRLHMRIGEKPYSAAWDAWMDKLFAWFDKDNNGSLSPAEVGRLIPANYLQNQVQGSIGGPSGQTVPFATLDTNKDGKVSREEFRAYYRNGGFSPLRFSNQNGEARNAKQTNDAIYKRLGVKPEGELKASDVAKLPGLMPKLDEDENELLTSAELNTESNNQPNYGFVVQPPRKMGRPQPMETGLIQIQPTTPAEQLVRQMVAYYDKNKDGKLTPGEVDPKFFAELDMDGDGKLDMEELKGFFRRPPDLVFLARIGPLNNSILNAVSRFAMRLGVRQTPRAEVLNPAAPLGKKVRKVNGDNLSFDLGDARFALQANDGFRNQGGRLNGVKNFYLNLFDSTVDKKKGYVEKSQEKANQQQPFLFQIFNQADKNGDGKLTRKESIEWLDLVSAGSDSFVTLQVNDMGRSLFNLIDTNSDSQLSVRELRTAWARMKPLCKEGKGLVQANLPRTLRISMGQGNTFFAPRPVPFGGAMTMGRPTANTGAPTWFTKMDINGDGDISPKEWLGTEEDFKEIDSDGDGLISALEARQYDARKKKDQTKKPAAPR